MASKLIDICGYAKEKIAVAGLTDQTYISTENMLPNKGGVKTATSLPSAENTQAYRKNDVLVSNIRPYFKKIWHAECDGGCSNDVLVFRAAEGVDPTYLYYVLADDNFFNYATATSKGTKMPRGDKSAIMEYSVPDFDIDVQRKIGVLLRSIDQRIAVNSTTIIPSMRNCSTGRARARPRTLVLWVSVISTIERGEVRFCCSCGSSNLIWWVQHPIPSWERQIMSSIPAVGL